MIDKTSILVGSSPLLSSRPPSRSPKESAPETPCDSVEWAGGVSFRSSEEMVSRAPKNKPEASKPQAKPAVPATLTMLEDDLKAAEKPVAKHQGWGDIGRKVGLGAALALTGLVGLSGVANAQQVNVQHVPAQGQTQMTLVDAVRASQPQRDTTPVRVNSVQDVVNQYTAQRQIYVVGNPQYQGRTLGSQDFARFEEVMKDHPNAYVVLIEQSSNVRQNDYDLSRGIGNSSQFQSVVDGETGQKNGAVFMIYFKVTDQGFIQRTGKDRAIYMRSETLLDEAGVGEGNFVDRETLQNRELMNSYVSAIQSGQDVPGALDAVMNRVDQGVETYLTQTVQGAESKITSAQGALRQVESKVRSFQREHGDHGELGKPDVEGWRSQLEEAQSRLAQRDFAGASRLAQSVQSSISSYEQAIGNFQNAPALAQEIQALINQAEQQIPNLPENGQRSQAERYAAHARTNLERFQASYDANNTDYQDQLTNAQRSAQSAVESVQASRDHAENMKNLKIYGSAAIGGALLITGVILNSNARGRKREANAELDKALGLVGERSKELIRVMNSADYNDISQYTGMTQKLANDLIASTADSLALMGGGEKFLAEAQGLIQGNTLGQRLQNMFFRTNFDEAIELLTEPDQKLPFDLSDSQQVDLESGSRAEVWRQQLLASVPAQPFQESFQSVIEQMAARGVKNDGLVTTIQTKSNEVGTYLDQVKGDAEKVQKDSLLLQEQGKDDDLFVSPSVTRRLLPTVLGDETQPGLLAKGHEVKQTDPVRAWDEFGDTSKRMANEGAQIVQVGQSSRQNLLPALNAADQALHPHDVKTDWAHSKKKELSIELDRAGEKAVREPVAEAVHDLNRQIENLQARVETVVEHDLERREVSPKLISSAESDVETARQGLFQALQASGVFENGSPDKVLREPDRDPTDLTLKSHEDWGNIKPNLDAGKIEQSGELLGKIRSQTAQAHQLVKESRDALNNYTATAEERRSRRDNISESLKTSYSDSLQRIQAGYAATAQKLVVAEVQSSATSKVDTVGDFLSRSQSQLESAGSLNLQAQKNYAQAYLLTSRDQLNSSDSEMRTAQANLDAIVSAERLLGQHQAAVEGELSALQGRVSGTQGKSNEHYVRRKAKSLVDDTKTQLEVARAAVQKKPADPYAARQALAVVENLRTQAESAISSDHRAYEGARSAISSAEREIRDAESEISSVARKSWSTYVSGYGSVSHSVSYSDLHSARSYLDSARRELSDANSQMTRQEYEQAKSDADSASSQARSAESAAERVESNEYSHYLGLVSSAKAKAERDEQNSSGGGSSGGGGGGGGGGGSGSTGGGW